VAVSSSDSPAGLDPAAIVVTWPDSQPSTVLANQFGVALGMTSGSEPDGFYLSVGHAEPPHVGEAELANIGTGTLQLSTQVDVHGRYFLTRGRLGELISLLERAALTYDEVLGGGRSDQP
jgi:hypothetical protein